MQSGSKKRLSRDDWVDAAVALGAEVGFEKLAVEPLAAKLGATRGSFYWHFTDRADLITAVLAKWENQAAKAIIEELAPLPANEALASLISTAFGASASEDLAEWQLFAASDDPLIGPAVARVHQLRIDFLERLFLARGSSKQLAKDSAQLAYATYLGSLTLRRLNPAAGDLGPALLRVLS
jgi:AcrR family transcriptional regulator